MSEIALSIVTGTYNRLPYLKNMVNSVRSSIGTGIPYEIVLVDGGSDKDDTIAWCKSQRDIVLIEQGELLGAIKAFNAGLFAARGEYCVIGNDDIIYVDETLTIALRYMQNNPDVGVGCFFQDRDHPGRWDLSRMPAVLDGKQVQHLYGQVCIVPKWLGDKVGWWGDFPNMRTYGGDNNLSCFVLEEGYKVTAVPCACICDLQAVDNLRWINNEYQQQTHKTGSMGHPDSIAWGRAWTHKDGTCGPIIKKDGPITPNPIQRKARFLYLPVYEQGHDIQRQQKRGLRDALARYGYVYEIDWLRMATEKGAPYMLNFVKDIIDEWEPDAFLTQIHTPDPRMFNANVVYEMRKEFPNLTWVNWNGDYHPEDLLSTGNIEMAKRFDVQCVVTTMVRDEYARHGVSWMYWQIGFEDSTAMPTQNSPRHDILFLANGYSRGRILLGRTLRALPYNVGIYGSWGMGVQPNGMNLYNFDAGARLYRGAKISIGDNQWGDKAVGFVSNRLFQALSAGGAMLLHQYIPGLEDLLGLKDGEHYVSWRTLGDMQDKINYYLSDEHEDERRAIADAGRDFIRANHSFDNRVQDLMEILV